MELLFPFSSLTPVLIYQVLQGLCALVGRFALEIFQLTIHLGILRANCAVVFSQITVLSSDLSRELAQTVVLVE